MNKELALRRYLFVPSILRGVIHPVAATCLLPIRPDTSIAVPIVIVVVAQSSPIRAVAPNAITFFLLVIIKRVSVIDHVLVGIFVFWIIVTIKVFVIRVLVGLILRLGVGGR
jgi:hypothetical protein